MSYKNLLLSLYDLTGNASRPYRENGWDVVQIDIQLGTNILTWDYTEPSRRNYERVGIIAMQPCTCYALSGNAHKKKRSQSGLFEGENVFNNSQQLVDRTRQIIEFYKNNGPGLLFWQLENPMTDIHKKNPWIGEIKLKFDPYEYAGYAPDPERDRYHKETWLFGDFNPPEKKGLLPYGKDSPVWTKYGGKSLAVKNARSVTPLGFAYAFYQFNH